MVETSLYAVSAERWWLSAAIGLLWVLASLYWMGVFRRVRMVTEGVVIAHASQTGTAEHLARVMKGQMDAASINSALLPLAELDEGALAHARKLVLIASTTGEGEAPDGVRHLEKTLLREALSLPHLKVFILALGDRSYDAFCAYGHRLAEWAKASEADVSLITVDHQASEDLARWDALMSANGLAPLSEAHSEGLIPWVVEARDEVASGDQSPIAVSRPGPLFRVSLAPEGRAMPPYAVGDLLEWHEETGERREFSIASVPGDRTLDLIVRRVELPEGAMGAASWALTADNAPLRINARIRSYPNFHEAAGHGPLLAVAAGSGWGGVRSHILSAMQKGRPVWLIYGERGPSDDAAVFAEMRRWHGEGAIKRLDLALSRSADKHTPKYAQEAVTRNAALIADFLGEDGAIAICGATAMGDGVRIALEAALPAGWINKARVSDRWRSATY